MTKIASCPMMLKYGTHAHRNGEVALTIERKPQLSKAEEVYAIEETWTIDGLLVSQAASDSAARTSIKRQQQALEAAYASDDRDVKLYAPDGRTLSDHSMISKDTLGGVRVIGPISYPQSHGTQNVTHSNYRITLQALKPVGNAAAGKNVILSFLELLSYEGGGPVYGMRETLIGPPRKYRSRMFSTYSVTQRGEAVGLFGRPAVPRAIWPSAQLRAPVITRDHPRRRINTTYLEWPISWEYTFGSADQLIGYPHVWGITY